MRRFILALVAVIVSSSFALARDIKTLAGDVYYNVTITRVEKTGIGVMHRSGVAFLDFSILQDDIRKEFGYTPEGYAAGKLLLAQQEQATLELQRKQAAEAAARREEQERATAAAANVPAPTITNRNYSDINYSTRTYTEPRYSDRAYSGGTVYVHGYTTKNGTYVAPHTRSAPSRRR
jgi:sRNA-binding protein